MGIREVAEADLAYILEDKVSGWGADVVLTSPGAVVYPAFVGFSTDISQAIDPQTGELVSGRTASVSLRISSLLTAGLTELPRAMAKTTEKPWLVTFLDLQGASYTFKVAQSRPDRAAGLLVCILEAYAP